MGLLLQPLYAKDDDTLFVSPAVSPAIPFAEFAFACLLACNIVRVAVGAGIFAVLNGFQVFEAFAPYLAAIHTFDRTDVLRKVAAFYMDCFSVDKTVGDFFPSG